MFIKNLRHISIKRYSTAQNFSYIHHIGNKPFIYRTLGQQLSITAKKYGDKEGLITLNDSNNQTTRFTFGEILNKVDRLAANFRKLGLQKNDRIGIWAPNYSHWYISMFAAARVGLVVVGINPAYQVPELEYCLNKVQVKCLIAAKSFKTQDYYKMILNVVPELETSKYGQINSKRLPSLQFVIIDADHKLPGALLFNELLSDVSEQEINLIEKMQSEIIPDVGCNIQFTSGTTGHPKAGTLSHHNIINNSYFVAGRTGYLDQNDHKVLLQMPYFHAYGLVIGIVANLHNGTTLVTPGPGFNANLTIKCAQKEKCTIIHGSPTMYVDIVKNLRESNQVLNTLEIGVTGGAPCSPQLFKDMKHYIGLKYVKTVFGMTELSAVSFQTLPNDTDEMVHSTVGHLQEHLEAKVVDDKGQPVPFGTPGELYIRGYSTMLEYWNDDKKTLEVYDKTKWFRTGDKFILHQNGYGSIVGRLKEIIIRGGENISPKEIEDFLNSHPDILESHVIGVPDERMGEDLCAYIRMSNGVLINHDELKNFGKNKIAHFKIPKHIRIVSDFPKTTSGKIQKFKLLEQFINETK